MLWTKRDTQVHTHAALGSLPIIRRDANTVIVTLTVEEALAFVHEITQAFGVEGVPASANVEEIHLVIENPNCFFPKEID
jgi:hypothetical protein